MQTGISTYSTQLGGKLYLVDGVNYAYYDPVGDTVEDWTATSGGDMPLDADNNAARLIATYRGRIVLAHTKKLPYAWWMSRVNDAFDWDYNPTEVIGGVTTAVPDPAMPVEGTNSPQGIVGDLITSLCPCGDDVLIFFGSHSIWAMRGDPLAGGSLDNISADVGGVWGICWARDPYGNIYFMSNNDGLYMMPPSGGVPQRLSQPVDRTLAESMVNPDDYIIRLAWDFTYQGLNVYLTPADESLNAQNWFWEQRSGSWWKRKFSNKVHCPTAVCNYDGSADTPQLPLLGCRDGHTRGYSSEVATDDGYVINSSVMLGPLCTPTMDEMKIRELQMILGEVSGDVDFAVYVGRTAEQAASASPVRTGTWKAGRNRTFPIDRSGHDLYIGLSTTNRWQMERIRVRLESLGMVRRRGR